MHADSQQDDKKSETTVFTLGKRRRNLDEESDRQDADVCKMPPTQRRVTDQDGCAPQVVARDVAKGLLNVVPATRLVQTAPTSNNGSNNPEPKLDMIIDGLPESDSENESESESKAGVSLADRRQRR